MSIVTIQFELNDHDPLYMQIFHHIKELILSNSIPVGSKLPSIRSVASTLNVNNITVINAYKQLELCGYIKSKQGSGFYVVKESNNQSPSIMITQRKKNDQMIDLASASPNPAIFPTETFKQYLVEVINRDKGFAFSYQEINGFMSLREVLVTFLHKTYGIKTNVNQIQIVSGAQQGIDIIAKGCLNSGDTVITENPTYFGALEVFKSRGCHIVPVNLNSEGLNLIELEKKIKICKPKLVYIMPKYQNPTTICYSKESLLSLLALAQKYNFYILEEDSMCELSYNQDPKEEPLCLKALDKNDKVIYLKSFSKLLMPGLRIGFTIMPSLLTPSFTKMKQTTDISSSGLIQRALELYFKNNKWDEHIHYMQEIYRGKYEYILQKLEALKEYGIEFKKPNGGLYFWIRLSENISAYELYEKCYKEGLLILPSSLFCNDFDPNKDRYIRLSFASASIDDIQKGIDILQECIVKISAK